MAIPEEVMIKLGILGFDLASDIIMDIVAERRSAGATSITVDELELLALKYKQLKDTETQKIRDRVKAKIDAEEGGGESG